MVLAINAASRATTLASLEVGLATAALVKRPAFGRVKRVERALPRVAPRAVVRGRAAAAAATAAAAAAAGSLALALTRRNLTATAPAAEKARALLVARAAVHTTLGVGKGVGERVAAVAPAAAVRATRLVLGIEQPVLGGERVRERTAKAVATVVVRPGKATVPLHVLLSPLHEAPLLGARLEPAIGVPEHAQENEDEDGIAKDRPGRHRRSCVFSTTCQGKPTVSLLPGHSRLWFTPRCGGSG